MNPPFITAAPTGVSGEIGLDISNMPIGQKARARVYVDGYPNMTSPIMWSTLLDPGFNVITGLVDGNTYAIYVSVEDQLTGSVLSWPSNLVKVRLPVVATYNISLKREVVETYVAHGVKAYRLQVSVASAVGVTDHVFLYKKEPPVGGYGTPENSFVCVCSAADLAQFPADAPLSGEPPFYRLNTVDVVEEELATIDRIWTDLKSAVDSLLIQLPELDDLRRVSMYTAYSGETAEPSLSSVSLEYSSGSSSSESMSSSSSESMSTP